MSPNHLLWVLEGLVAGEVHNRITVPDDRKSWTKVVDGLTRMRDQLAAAVDDGRFAAKEREAELRARQPERSAERRAAPVDPPTTL